MQRRREAETVLQAYREPLVGAAFELQSRLYNILAPERDFVGRYLRSADPERRAVAMRTTLYVFAQYFGWIEIIRREIEFLRFPRTEQTREVARVVREIGETFLTDEYGTGLMIWRVEQRGIGEQMISPLGQRPTCLGYASFLESKVPERLEAVERGLLAMDDGSRERLTAIQHLALQLVRLLDPDHVRYPFELKAA